MRKYFIIKYIILLFTALSINYCINIQKLTLPDDPEFLDNIRKYYIDQPIVHPADDLSVTIKDSATAVSYKTGLDWSKETELDGFIESIYGEDALKALVRNLFSISKNSSMSDLDIEEMEVGEVAEVDEYVYHSIDLTSFIKKIDYKVVGRIVSHRTIEQTSSLSSSESSIRLYPVEFYILENDMETGTVFIDKPTRISAIDVRVMLHQNTYWLQYQTWLNNKRVNISSDGETLAFVRIDAPSSLTTREKGEIYLKDDLDEAEKDDVFIAYLLTDIIIHSFK